MPEIKDIKTLSKKVFHVILLFIPGISSNIFDIWNAICY